MSWMKQNKPIYVEVEINSEMDDLWNATQEPHIHEKWDLRFSSITYLPKEVDEPQAFLYETNIGFGLRIKGWGKSVGKYNGNDGSRTSSLHFGTDQAISIIREGRGYWKYTPNDMGNLTFLTEYNYKTNWGRFGQLIDRFIFRPLMGWATALSFDVLKRWLEKDVQPRLQYFRFFTQWALVFLFFFIWMYHGLIPKLFIQHEAEIAMFQQGLLLTEDNAKIGVVIFGICEVLFGLIWLTFRNKRPLFLLQAVLFPLLTLGAIIADPITLYHPFSPLTFNLALFILSIIGWAVSKEVPTAKQCKRSR